MPRKTHTDRDKRGSRGRTGTNEIRTPRPKPKIDFTADALDYKNVNLLKQFVTEAGRILPRTGFLRGDDGGDRLPDPQRRRLRHLSGLGRGEGQGSEGRAR